MLKLNFKLSLSVRRNRGGGGGVMEMLTLLTRGGWGVIEILTLDDGGGMSKKAKIRLTSYVHGPKKVNP